MITLMQSTTTTTTVNIIILGYSTTWGLFYDGINYLLDAFYVWLWMQCSGTIGSGARGGDGCRCCSMVRRSVGEYQCPVLMVVPSNGHNAGRPAAAATKKPESGGKKLRFQLAKERKASTTLGIIMSAFTVCWLPFFVLALVRPFLSDPSSIPSSLSSLFLWLGYANSLLNPVSVTNIIISVLRILLPPVWLAIGFFFFVKFLIPSRTSSDVSNMTCKYFQRQVNCLTISLFYYVINFSINR